MFGALETIESNSESIDKLASLVNSFDMKLDRRETQYRPKIYQGRNRGCGQRQDNYRLREGSYNRDHGQYNNRGRRNYNNDRNYRPNYRAGGQEMAMETGEMMGLIICKVIE